MTAPQNPSGIVRMSDVAAEIVRWLWMLRIVLGKLNLLEGDPGLGKSILTAALAGAVSRGGLMPDGSKGGLNGPAGVIMLSAEDGLADTIRPRLEAAGADLDRVVVWESIPDHDGTPMLPSIPEDIPALEELVLSEGAKLVIVDPIMSYLSGDTNSYRDQDVRRALTPLAKMAERTGAAVLIVRHLNKAVGGSAIYRGGGSIGIIGAARSGLLVAKHPDDEERRVLASVKSNLGPPPPSLEFHVEGAPNGAALIKWDGLSQLSANDLVSPGREPSPERKEIVAYVRDAGNPIGPKDVAYALDKNESTVRWHLSQAVKEGQIERTATGMYAPKSADQRHQYTNNANNTNGVDTGRLNPVGGVGDDGPLVTLGRLPAWERPGECRECAATLKTPDDLEAGYCDWCRARGKAAS